MGVADGSSACSTALGSVGWEGEGRGGRPAGPVGRLQMASREGIGVRARGAAWAAGPGARAERLRAASQNLPRRLRRVSRPQAALPPAIPGADRACRTRPGRVGQSARAAAPTPRLRARHEVAASACTRAALAPWLLIPMDSGMCGSLPAIRACRLQRGSCSRGLPASPGPVRPGLGALPAPRSRGALHRARRTVPGAGGVRVESGCHTRVGWCRTAVSPPFALSPRRSPACDCAPC